MEEVNLKTTSSSSPSNTQEPRANAWVRFWRHVYRPLGFKKGYNFPLFVILAGALMGFTLARFSYLNIVKGLLPHTIPFDAAQWSQGIKKVAITIHLACILPASFLVCFQFVPIIRYKFLLFHRMNGYVIILLLLVSNVGAYMLTPTAGGGSMATQTLLESIATATTISIILAYVNVKRLQLEQHRAWMIRTWVIAGSIITLRIFQGIAFAWLFKHPGNGFYDVQTCAQIWGQYALKGIPAAGNPTPKLYPQCTSPTSSLPIAIPVPSPGHSGPEVISAASHLTFAMAGWMALIVHAIGVELYLHLTPAEAERLRHRSYERQVEKGIRQPGRSGLTADRIGDAPMWLPKDVKSESTKKSSTESRPKSAFADSS